MLELTDTVCCVHYCTQDASLRLLLCSCAALLARASLARLSSFIPCEGRLLKGLAATPSAAGHTGVPVMSIGVQVVN
jgi:hypothetical protein